MWSCFPYSSRIQNAVVVATIYLEVLFRFLMPLYCCWIWSSQGLYSCCLGPRVPLEIEVLSQQAFFFFFLFFGVSFMV